MYLGHSVLAGLTFQQQKALGAIPQLLSASLKLKPTGDDSGKTAGILNVCKQMSSFFVLPKKRSIRGPYLMFNVRV